MYAHITFSLVCLCDNLWLVLLILWGWGITCLILLYYVYKASTYYIYLYMYEHPIIIKGGGRLLYNCRPQDFSKPQHTSRKQVLTPWRTDTVCLINTKVVIGGNYDIFQCPRGTPCSSCIMSLVCALILLLVHTHPHYCLLQITHASFKHFNIITRPIHCH